MRVLLLSASTGNGHTSAARAIEEELRSQGVEATTVDVLDYTGKGFRGWYRGGYEVLVKRNPKVWGHLYRSSDRKLFNYWVQTGLDRLFVGRMRKFMASQEPDWVVCTHSLPQPTLAKWRNRWKFRVAVVVTDLYPQRMWLRGRPDWFFVPGEWSRTVLERRYPLSKGRTTVSGIPVSRVFVTQTEKSAARAKLGLDASVDIVLVTSGGIGGGPISGAVSEIAQIDGVHIVVVCGRNEVAFEAVNRVAEGFPGRVDVKAQVDPDDMALLMRSSNLIVAKPGGITTFEALACGLPFIVYWPFLIPGQEEKNAEFLETEGIGAIVKDSTSLKTKVADLLSDRAALESMACNAMRHAKPEGAKIIAEKLIELGP